MLEKMNQVNQTDGQKRIGDNTTRQPFSTNRADQFNLGKLSHKLNWLDWIAIISFRLSFFFFPFFFYQFIFFFFGFVFRFCLLLLRFFLLLLQFCFLLLHCLLCCCLFGKCFRGMVQIFTFALEFVYRGNVGTHKQMGTERKERTKKTTAVAAAAAAATTTTTTKCCLCLIVPVNR